MKRRTSGLRIALLASTALTAFALLSSPEEALAACPNNPVQTINGDGSAGNISAGSTTSALTITGTGTVTVGGGQGSQNNCAIYVASVGSTIIFGNGLTTSGSEEAIVIAGTDNFFDFSARRLNGGGGVAITDLPGNDTTLNFFAASLATSQEITGDLVLGDGNDIVSFQNVIMSDQTLLGSGNDRLTLSSSGTPQISGLMDGGADSDTLRLTGSGSGTTGSGALYANFETLTKEGTGTWTIENGTYDFDVLNVDAGTLVLASDATLNIVSGTVNGGTFTVESGATVNATGNSMTYNAGTTNIFGVFNEAGDTTVTGAALLWVRDGGEYNAGDPGDPGGTTTVTGSGELRVGDGGLASYDAFGATVVTGGTINVRGGGFYGSFGQTTIDGGTLQIDAGGSYVVVPGSTLVGGAGSDTIIIGGMISFGAGGNLGAGDDTVVVLDTFTGILGVIDADANTPTGDNFVLAGSGSGLSSLGSFGNAAQFRRFENLVKSGSGTWVLTDSNGTTAADGLFQALTVGEGTLIVSNGATLSIVSGAVNGGTFIVEAGAMVNATGNSMIYNAGQTQIAGVFNEAGDTTVTGTAELLIQPGGVYNAGDGPEDTTTVSGGVLRLNGGTYTASGVTLVNGGTLQIDTGTYTSVGTVEVASGTILVNGGAFDADVQTEVIGGTLRVNGGTYTAAGATFVQGGLLQVDGGTYQANGNVLVQTSQILVNGGAFNAAQITTVNSGGVIRINGGTYTATGVTNVQNAGTLQVDDGTYQANGNVILVTDGNILVNTNGAMNATMLTSITGGTLRVNGGTYTASGTTTVSGGLLQVDGGTYDQVGGDVLLQSGDILVNGGAMNAALLTTVTGGTLRVNTGTYAATGATTVNGGVLRVDGGTYHAIADVTLTTGDILVNGGAFDADAQTHVDGGVLRVNSGTYTAGGATFVQGGLLQVDGGTYQANGNVLVQSVELLVNGGAFNAAQITTVNNGGRIRINSGTYTATGVTNVQNAGSLQVDGGTYQANGNVILVAGGNILVNPTGAMNAVSMTTVTGGLLRVNGGLYTATGSTTVNGGTVQVDAGTYQANNTVLVASGLIVVNGGGTFNVADGFATEVNGGTLRVSGGTINAGGTTTVNGVGLLQVDGGTYNAGNDPLDVTNIESSGRILVNGGVYNANAQTNMSGSSQLGVFGPGLYDGSSFIIRVNGGTVLGTGTIITAQLQNVAGDVSPGNGAGDVGTLNLVGLYTQQAGGNFQADLQPGGPPDLLNVTGSAALLGNVQLNTLSSGFGMFEQHRIIATDNPIPTIFDTASVSGAGLGSSFAWVGRVDDAGDFDPDDPASGNNVDVIIATSPAALSGLTPNQQAVADYFGSYAMPGGVYIEDAAILLITEIAAAGPNALDQIGGEVYDSFTTFAFDTGRQYGRMVDDRVRMLRCAAKSGSASPLCATETPTLLADTGPDSIPTPGADSPRGFSPNTHPYGWSIWASAIGSFLSKDRTSTNLGYSGSTYGGVMGVDLAITKRWIVGVMVGGSFSNIDFSGVGGDGDLSNMGVGVYTAWLGSRWFASASFTYSKNWIEADRTLQFGTVDTTANGKTEGDQLAAHATLGYGFSISKVALEVAGGIDWVQLRQDAFTETGAGLLNLSVRSRTDDSLRLRIGVRAAVPFQVRTGLMLTPSAKVGYAREVLDNTRPITSSLSPIPGTFTVHGDDGSRNIVTFGAGVKADWSQGVTVSLDYNGEWAGDRQIHGIQGRIQIRW